MAKTIGRRSTQVTKRKLNVTENGTPRWRVVAFSDDKQMLNAALGLG